MLIGCHKSTCHSQQRHGSFVPAILPLCFRSVWRRWSQSHMSNWHNTPEDLRSAHTLHLVCVCMFLWQLIEYFHFSQRVHSPVHFLQFRDGSVRRGYVTRQCAHDNCGLYSNKYLPVHPNAKWHTEASPGWFMNKDFSPETISSLAHHRVNSLHDSRLVLHLVSLFGHLPRGRFYLRASSIYA